MSNYYPLALPNYEVRLGYGDGADYAFHQGALVRCDWHDRPVVGNDLRIVPADLGGGANTWTNGNAWQYVQHGGLPLVPGDRDQMLAEETGGNAFGYVYDEGHAGYGLTPALPPEWRRLAVPALWHYGTWRTMVQRLATFRAVTGQARSMSAFAREPVNFFGRANTPITAPKAVLVGAGTWGLGGVGEGYNVGVLGVPPAAQSVQAANLNGTIADACAQVSSLLDDGGVFVGGSVQHTPATHLLAGMPYRWNGITGLPRVDRGFVCGELLVVLVDMNLADVTVVPSDNFNDPRKIVTAALFQAFLDRFTRARVVWYCDPIESYNVAGTFFLRVSDAAYQYAQQVMAGYNITLRPGPFSKDALAQEIHDFYGGTP